tara:strand:+ start:537 stop:1007 length:471 start_codon:yes stop_codon:yes gene_type:complete
MKKFRELRQEIHENTGGETRAGFGVGRSARDSISNLNDITLPETQVAVNAFIENFLDRKNGPCLNPGHKLAELRARLNTVGINFDMDVNRVEEGQRSFPLNAYGGRFGFIDMDGVVKEDDGIAYRNDGVGLSLDVSVVREDGMYRMEAKIVPGSSE